MRMERDFKSREKKKNHHGIWTQNMYMWGNCQRIKCIPHCFAVPISNKMLLTPVLPHMWGGF